MHDVHRHSHGPETVGLLSEDLSKPPTENYEWVWFIIVPNLIAAIVGAVITVAADMSSRSRRS